VVFWLAFRDLLEFLGYQESKAPEVFQDLLVKRVKRENLHTLVCFQRDRKENQDWMEGEDLLDHQEDRETLALRDEKGKLVVRCVPAFF
jgi:hypothetical protein